ncbi:hypothetical protein SKAU_G00048570 [Synaphobranchus kaupii]|uniref:Uncharacterized protein n=1 Tax=Synaphobranchus kaupii TaxID=118154 RepID=A0A9Q1G3I8_SYNKA|nr:hypothetical protein SKAU_G00048570 [Synaphobranchus kaupii]
MREAGQRVQPNLSRYTVASIIRIFRLENRRPEGGRQRLFTHEQELAIVNIVLANNTIRLHQLRGQIISDHRTFHDINRVSISTLCRILRQHQLTMKQLYRVTFERNSVRVKDLRYVQRVLDFDAAAQPHGFIFRIQSS